MKLKNILFFLLFINIFIFSKVFAFQITKVSGPVSYPWIEIYNDSDIVKDITGYKVFDSGAATNGHAISTTNIGSSFLIAANSYFIIAKDETRSALQNISCPVFHSSLGVKLGDNLLFKKTDDISSTNVSILDTLSSTSCGTGNIENISTTTNSTSTNSNNSTTTSTSTNEIVNNGVTNTVYVYLPSNNQNKYGDINVLLPSEKVVPAGADSDFTVKVTDSQKNILTGLDFNWSFGDGGEKFGKNVNYHYTYPGEYTLIATADGYIVSGEAKMKVNVISPDISILKVGTNKDENFIDLKNNTGYDLFLSDFYIFVDGEYYKLPKKFIIEKGKVVHVSGEALGFHLPASNVALYYPNKNLLTSYKNLIIPILNPVEINNNKQIENSNSLNVSNINTVSTNLIPKNIEIQNNLNKNLSENNYKNPVKTKKETNIENVLYVKPLLLASKDIKEIGKDFKANVKNNNTVDTGLIKWIKNLIY